LLSYSTKQQVNIQDRYLGLTTLCLQLLILLYIIFGVVILGKGYLEFEEAPGAIAVHVRGDAAAVSSGRPGTRYFSAEEISYPGLENGNVFVATRQKIYRQKRGICEDLTMTCNSDEECTIASQGRCTERGYCEEPSWCNIDPTPEIYELEVGNFEIWIKSSIQFIRLAPTQVYSTEAGENDKLPHVHAYSVRDLLTMCQPTPVRYEEISELGAAVEVQFFWKCNVAEDHCMPEIHARRVDDDLSDPNNIGYSFSYPEYITEDERLLNELHGVRIFLRSVGQGRKVSVTAFIMKASTASALLSLAPIIADLLMLKLFGLRSKKYFARKYELSPDFSDYMENLKAKKAEAQIRADLLEEDDDQELRERELDWQKQLDEDDY